MANATGNPGEFLITSITGTLTGSPIVSLLPASPAVGSYDGNDNLLETAMTSLVPDGNGFSLLLSSGVTVNIFTATFPTAGQFLQRSDNPNADYLWTSFQITPVPSAVPEPASWLLLATGGASLFGMRRRLFGAR